MKFTGELREQRFLVFFFTLTPPPYREPRPLRRPGSDLT